MPLRLPEPGSFERLLQEYRVPVAALQRLSRYPKREPFFSRGRFRFDGSPAGQGGSFGTCYAGLSLDVAFAESVIHEASWWHEGRFQVPAVSVDSRHRVLFQRPAAPELVLADFTGAALKRLGLNNDLCSGDDYTLPMAWAAAVHDADAKWDGIAYVSRQVNDGLAVAVFERAGIKRKNSRKLTLRQRRLMCARFGVVVV